MSSNRHYDYDDDTASHLHHQLHHQGGVNDPSHDSDYCQPLADRACIEACPAMSSVNQMAMCGFDPDRLSSLRPSNYFGLAAHSEDGSSHHSSPYLYSPGAPVGPTTCEYCGNRNTDDCISNLPEDYLALGGHGGVPDGSARSGGANLAEAGDPYGARARANSLRNRPDINDYHEICPRPKLFFLKKRPPFATPDGWNPVTGYRLNMFEPPSSMEGMGRGWREVRGQIGNGAGSSYNAASVGGVGNLNRSYVSGGCGSSACGGGAETEVSSSTATGDRGTNVTTSDGGRSLSPVQWVSGLMGALSPS